MKPMFAFSVCFIFKFSSGLYYKKHKSIFLLELSFIHLFNLFGIFARVEQKGDSYWFCFLSNKNLKFFDKFVIVAH